MNKKLGKNAKLLVINDIFYSLISIFISTFLVAYFLKITNENITKVSIYYIIIYSLLGIGMLILSKVIKKHPKYANIIMCSGIVMRSLFLLFIVILADKIISYYVLIAVFYAIGESLFWSAHELIYIDVTTIDNRRNFMSTKKILTKIISIIAPVILGTSIEVYSFSRIASYVFILSVIQIAVALSINTNLSKAKREKYGYKEFAEYVKKNNINKIKSYNLSGIPYGIVESSINTLIIIITIMTFKTSFNLGILTTIFSLCSMASLMLYNKFYNKNNAKFILWFCSAVMVFGVCGLLININKTSLIIYNFCYTVTFYIFDVVYNTRKGDIVKECDIENYREEYIAYTSIPITVGRIIGYALMLIVSFTTNVLYFKILLAIVTLFAPLYCYLSVKSLK